MQVVYPVAHKQAKCHPTEIKTEKIKILKQLWKEISDSFHLVTNVNDDHSVFLF